MQCVVLECKFKNVFGCLIHGTCFVKGGLTVNAINDQVFLNDTEYIKHGIDYHSPTVSKQPLVYVVGNPSCFFQLMLAELSFYYPNQSSSLLSASRHAAEASWNIQREGGREGGRRRRKSKGGR